MRSTPPATRDPIGPQRFAAFSIEGDVGYGVRYCLREEVEALDAGRCRFRLHITYALPLARRQATARLERLDAYPGLDGSEGVDRVSLDFRRAEDVRLLTPPGGQPASMTALPGLGGDLLGSLPTYPLAALPGSSGAFDTVVTGERRVVVGSPRVRRSTGMYFWRM